MQSAIGRYLTTFLLLSASCFAQSACTTYFTVVLKDRLNNVKQGLSAEDQKWFQSKMVKKYSGLCYAPPAPSIPLVLYVWAAPATYHGNRVITDTATHSAPVSGTVTDDTVGSPTYGQEVGTIQGQTETTTSSSAVVPYSVDYLVLTLSVERRNPAGGFTVLHNFQGKTLCRAMYGVCISNRHPRHALIEDALKWIHAGGLSDPMQSVQPN